MKRLLVVDLKEPINTHYCDHKTIGNWLWGRFLSRYRLIVINEVGQLNVLTFNTGDCTIIQEIVNKEFNE